MRISTILDYAGDPSEAVEDVKAYEAAGLDLVWVAEAWTFDAVSLLGYLAASTSRVQLGSGIFNIYSRTPALLAMTAAGLDSLSNGRFNLGIGASGPQVVEGWHGVAYDAPVGRTDEVIDICRKVWRREELSHDGKHYQLPLAGGLGLGKSLKLINRPLRADIPIYNAALGPRNVTLTAEKAEGWIPVFFYPEK
ncbi:MAG: LLM class flavin-dependent oxidoreductase, partial [Acidimicrobiia bacterium]|nr:LLM class flavin-dependent oxidoreductase [Acidimicrobiia bacterium]